MDDTESYGSLLANIRKFVDFTAQDEIELISILRITRIRKRQFVDQPGFVSGYRNYVVRGALRSFFMDRDGKDHTIQIAVEDWFISDFHSYISQTPATLYVEALEDSVLVQMKYEDIEKLCSRNHHLSEYFRITTERAFANSRRRALSNLSKTAEARYLEFIDRYPGMAYRIPQKVIASYLGISPEFLSKIRAQLTQKS